MRRPETKGDGDQTAFSVVIPTYNRPASLARCLDSLAHNEAPAGGFEVIVVDDGSDEPLNEVVDSFSGRLDIRLLSQRNGGPSSARNAGARVARGRFLAFTDDDCVPSADWLHNLANRLESAPDRLVGGKTINRLADNSYAVASQIIVDAVYAFYNATPEEALFFASNNMAVAAELLAKVGGFDTRSFPYVSEDRELCDRWRHLGYRMTYAPEATVFHAHPLRLASFCKQHFTYGRGARRYHRVRAGRGSGRFSDDVGFHARLVSLLREPMARIPLGQRLKVLMLLGLWQVANAAGFFLDPLLERKRAKK